MTEYQDERYLMLSGLQHFLFCRRQWALIHIEQQWAENLRTVDGTLLHGRAHNDGLGEKRGDTITVRGVRLSSRSLGVSGQCDVLEFHKDPAGVPLARREGLWMPFPVEYKRGQPKENDSDRAQLCCQAMCLEEMLCTPIARGALFYGETRRREEVVFTEALRWLVRDSLTQMHALYERGATPRVKPSKRCNACSLKELCLPTLMKDRPVSAYLSAHLEETP